MCELLDVIDQKGFIRGFSKGEECGKKDFADNLRKASDYLISQNRTKDAMALLKNPMLTYDILEEIKKSVN